MSINVVLQEIEWVLNRPTSLSGQKVADAVIKNW